MLGVGCQRRGEERRGEERRGEERRGERGAGSPGFILHKQLFKSSLRCLKSSESLPALQCRSVFSHRSPACSHHKDTKTQRITVFAMLVLMTSCEYCNVHIPSCGRRMNVNLVKIFLTVSGWRESSGWFLLSGLFVGLCCVFHRS